MLTRTVVSVVVGVFISAGIAGSAWAEPNESQRLRGLGDRVFFVQVHDLFADEFFDNCYTFYADGTWDDPLFPALGAWNRNSVGTKTSYYADALGEDFDVGGGLIVDVLLEQVGTVTPARGKGNLQLSAFPQAFLVDFPEPGENLVVGEFLSVGCEVDECPL